MPAVTRTRSAPLATLLALVPALALASAACRSPERWASKADRDVYALVDARRAELFGTDEPFTIEPPADSLRARILAREAPKDPYPPDVGPAEVGPPELPPQEVELDLVDCLLVAAESSRAYQSRRESLFRAALDVTLERYLVGWRPRVTGGAEVAGEGSTAEEAVGFLNPELRRVLGTGAEVVAGVGIDLFRSLATSDGWDLSSSFALAITQPLLRGAGPHIVYEALTQAERDLVYEVRTYERFRRSLAVDVADRYYRILQQIDVVANEQRNFENLEILSRRNRDLAEAGRLSAIQADQALQDELRARNRVLVARARLDTQLDAFKLFLGLPIEVRLSLYPGELARLQEGLSGAADLDPEPVVAFALEHRLDFRTALDQVEDAERRVRVAADALRMGLDLSASAVAPSETGKPLRFDLEDARWSVGLGLDLPVGRLPQRNSYRNSLITLQAVQRSAEELADSIAVDLRDALREARTTLESYEIQRNAEQLAALRVESTALNLEAGRGDTRDILEAQESLVQAQNASTRALIDHAIARLALFRDMELLRVDEAGIHVAPFLPEAATPEVDE